MDIISFPVLISKEVKWFVASCPILDIATQGSTEEEVKENMVDLIKEYMEDPDTQKPDWETIISTSVAMTLIPVKIRGAYRGTKTSPLLQHEVIRILETNGFQRMRSRKHLTFKKKDSDGRVWTTWVPKHKEVPVFVF